jgi:WhiB family redox-sensing transcriptional regulator
MNDWRARARCRTKDPEVWFPDPRDDTANALAVRICQRCPVIRECDIYADKTGQGAGVWGGVRERDRIARRRRRKRQRQPA